MTTPPDPWVVASVIASSVSAIAAAIALVYTAWQLKISARAAAFQAAETFTRDIRQRLEDCDKSRRNSTKFQRSATELVASFELFSVAFNDGLLSSRARRYVAETLVDYLDDMNEAGYGAHLTGLQREHVCRETKAFILKHRSQFRDYSGVRQMMGMS